MRSLGLELLCSSADLLNFYLSVPSFIYVFLYVDLFS